MKKVKVPKEIVPWINGEREFDHSLSALEITNKIRYKQVTGNLESSTWCMDHPDELFLAVKFGYEVEDD